jgi:hypothetical protein
VLAAGLRTGDLRGKYGGDVAGARLVGTVEMGDAIAAAVAATRQRGA